MSLFSPKKLSNFPYVLLFFIFFIDFFSFSSSSSLIVNNTEAFYNYTSISDFRLLNRRVLFKCPNPSPYLEINISSNSTLSNEEYIAVTISGVLKPSDSDWVAMISPTNSSVNYCPTNAINYQQTGDFSILPLLCHYPVKGQYLKNDPSYLGCKNKECKKYEGDKCVENTCKGSVTFHVINIRTDIEFVFFTGGFLTPCILKRSTPLKFSNPNSPLYAHISSIDSTATSMRVTWVSGDKEAQEVQYLGGKSEKSQVTTFTQADMCNSVVGSPAKDFGWHDPGFIHSAVMTGFNPSTSYSYRYGSDSVGWSDEIHFKTPPAGGSDKLKFLAYGDMGKAPRDKSLEHYIQPGSPSVMDAMTEEVERGEVDSIFHIGDISYATGFLVEWDFFLHQIERIASHVTYMTAIGNHERDYIDSGSVYITPDSGGECGVAYETYFQMPTPGKDKPWYSIEQASIHFTVISTENTWTVDSEQWKWMKQDLESVNRSITPWVIFMGHRPMYTSILLSGDQGFVEAVEPLLMENKVDLALWGHVHNYERSCAVYKGECKAMPTKDANGVYTYDNSNYSAPVHAVIGMAGFTLDKFPRLFIYKDWSLVRISEFGYIRANATREELQIEFVNSTSRAVADSFRFTKIKGE